MTAGVQHHPADRDHDGVVNERVTRPVKTHRHETADNWDSGFMDIDWIKRRSDLSRAGSD